MIRAVLEGASDDAQHVGPAVTDRITALTAVSGHLDRKGLALLIVWAFLAGFSETLVPNLLSKTEKSIDGSA